MSANAYADKFVDESDFNDFVHEVADWIEVKHGGGKR